MEKNILSWNNYLEEFDTILTASNPVAPYDDAAYLDYVKLNHNRLHRWLKKGKLNDELKELVSGIKEKQTWYLITEPWCGDAAHSAPFLFMLSELNPLIKFKIVLRDTAPFMIENYLTNGTKSIPKLIVKNSDENDLFTWGPRPEGCQNIYQELKNQDADFDTIKVGLQKWYNKDKGITLQDEILALFKSPI